MVSPQRSAAGDNPRDSLPPRPEARATAAADPRRIDSQALLGAAQEVEIRSPTAQTSIACVAPRLGNRS